MTHRRLLRPRKGNDFEVAKEVCGVTGCYHRGMDFQFVVDLLTAVCAACAAVGVYRLQRNRDVMGGKVQAIEAERRMRT